MSHTQENSPLSLNDFISGLPFSPDRLESVLERYPFRASSYYLNLIESQGDPIWRQVMPDPAELEDDGGWEDPLGEEDLSPVPGLVHRYANRVLWLIADRCAINCRFCTRKRLWNKKLRGGPSRCLARSTTDSPTTGELESALDYISSHEEIRDVLLSGGDPFLLPLDQLGEILQRLRNMPHVEIIRIGTRLPCVLPARIDGSLAELLKKHHPVYVNVHFNHPRELTTQARRACATLADAGIPLGSQTVLLRGINDRAEVLAELFQGLLSMRVRPYYLMQMDLVRGTKHFRTPLATGLGILRSLRNVISGLAVPQFVMDLPGGHGKIPLLPNYVMRIEDARLLLRNHQGRVCSYPLLPGEHTELRDWLTLHHGTHP